jgi:serine O-acetyltransferase
MARPEKLGLLASIARDFQAALDNDPAAHGAFAKLEIMLTYPGFHAITLHRITHQVYRLGLPILPKVMSMLNRFLTGIEIHQAAKIGPGFFIDHGMGVVIGETAIVGEDCMLFHGVTLGGTGKATGKRHPTLLKGVVVGAGAKILGNITIGNNCYVGANSVVLKDVPDNSTVVGIPGRIVARDGKKITPSVHPLDHNLPDPVLDRFRGLEERMDEQERELLALRRKLAIDSVDVGSRQG